MKRNLLFLALSFCCTTAFSQVKIYPKVGMVVSSQNLVFGEGESRENSEINNRVGMQFGVGLEKPLSQRIALSADLLYTELGYFDRSKISYAENEAAYKLNYLISPVSVKYYVTKVSTHQFFLTAGTYGGIFMNGKRAYSHKNLYSPSSSYSGEVKFGVNERYDYDMLDWGLQFGAGMNFTIGKSEFALSSGYALGMSNVTEISNSTSRWEPYRKGWDGKNKFFTVNLGYALPTWKRKSNSGA